MGWDWDVEEVRVRPDASLPMRKRKPERLVGGEVPALSFRFTLCEGVDELDMGMGEDRGELDIDVRFKAEEFRVVTEEKGRDIEVDAW